MIQLRTKHPAILIEWKCNAVIDGEICGQEKNEDDYIEIREPMCSRCGTIAPWSSILSADEIASATECVNELLADYDTLLALAGVKAVAG